MELGWISLHRKILDNPVLSRGRTYSRFEAFIYMLLKANHKDNKIVIGNQLISVKKGSFVKSQKKLMRIFNWGSAKLRAFIFLLKKDKMIDIKTTTQATMITIINYSSYQNIQKTNGKQTENKQKSNGKQTETNNKPNKDNKEIRETNFRQKSIDYFNKFLPKEQTDLLESFCDYWTESNTGGKKMKFEMQRTFQISRRITKWIKNNKEWNKDKIITKYKPDDYGFDTTGITRMGRCEGCKTIVFGNAYTIHKDDSKCCNAKIVPHK